MNYAGRLIAGVIAAGTGWAFGGGASAFAGAR